MTHDRYITKSSECNIIQFRKCKFEEDYECLVISGSPSLPELRNAFLNIFFEYIDISGLSADSSERTLMKQEYMIGAKITVIENVLWLNDLSLKLMQEPNYRSLPMLELHGVSLSWNEDVENFKQQMEGVKTGLMNDTAELFQVQKELKQLRKKNNGGNSPNDNEDKFLDMLNILETTGNRIDEEKLSVKRLALMIKRHIKMTEMKENKN